MQGLVRQLPPVDLLADKTGKKIQVGIFLDFASSTARTPHEAYVQISGRNRIDPHWGEIERLARRALIIIPARAVYLNSREW